MKIKDVFVRLLIVLLSIFLIVGVPFIINECYKSNCGYVTVWNGADMLGYYGTILGAVIAVLTLVLTIVFTKKQIQRESFLKDEKEKLSKLESIFLEILDRINPIETLKNVLDIGFSDPSKAINILQKYQMNCKTSCDRLNAHLNMSDYPKFKKIVDSIASISEEFVSISQSEIDQYTALRLLAERETALKILQNEEKLPGSFSQKDLAFSTNIIEKTNDINFDDIDNSITKLNNDFVIAYETKFRSLLQLNGATFEEANNEVRQQADNILRFRRK